MNGGPTGIPIGMMGLDAAAAAASVHRVQSVLTYKQLRLGPEVSNCLFWNKE